MVLCIPKIKRMHYNFKIKLNEKQIYETNSVKYFSEIIDNKLNWDVHIDDVAFMVIRANTMLK